MEELKLKEFIENKSEFFKNNIVALCITEKILNNQVKSKVISIYGYNEMKEKISLSLPFIEGMRDDYLLNVFHLFSKKENLSYNLDSLEKKACEQIYSETENYYRINIITKEKNKKYIINIFKYYARLLDYDISINSLAPIYSDFNELINKNDIDHKIREVSYDILDEYFNTSSIARIQIIYVLSLLLTRYTDIQEVHQFMKNTNLKLQLNKVNFIDHYYLNNQILSKKLLSYGEHMEIQSEIVINSNYDILRLDNNDGIKANQLLFFRMNDNNMNNPKQIITGIYFMIDNEVCFIKKYVL